MAIRSERERLAVCEAELDRLQWQIGGLQIVLSQVALAIADASPQTAERIGRSMAAVHDAVDDRMKPILSSFLCGLHHTQPTSQKPHLEPHLRLVPDSEPDQ